MKIIKQENGNVLLILTEKEEEQELKANVVDASFEKHVPKYRMNNNLVEVYVEHVMEEDHYIEWILVDYGEKQIIKEFHPHEEAKVVVEYQENMKAYSYCNKHSLWSSKLEKSI